MVHGVSLPNVTQFNPADRLVHERDGFKPAGSGSLIGRAINWVRETFFRGSIDRANVDAYKAARAEWRRDNGTVETPQVKSFFDAKINARSVFSLAELRPLLAMPATMQRTETVASALLDPAGPMLGGLADNVPDSGNGSTHVTIGATDVKLREQFLKDVARSTYVVEGAAISSSGVDAQGENLRLKSNKDVADVIGPALVAAFGADVTEAISNCAHQALGLPVTGMIAGMDGEAARLSAPDGRKLQLVTLPQGGQTYELNRNGDGSVHVKYTQAFAMVPGDAANLIRENPVSVMTNDSRGTISYSFDIVRKPGGGGYEMANVSPATYDYTIGIRRGFEDLLA